MLNERDGFRDNAEPYRERLRDLRDRLQLTLRWLDGKIRGQSNLDASGVIHDWGEVVTR